jgi:hypothetical protein
MSVTTLALARRKSATTTSAGTTADSAVFQRHSGFARQVNEGALTSQSGSSSGSRVVREAGHSSGAPQMPENLAFTEPRFEHDFSRVPIDSDARAAEVSRTIRQPFRSFEPSFGQKDYLDQSANAKPAATKTLTVVEHNRQPFSAAISCADHSRLLVASGASGDRPATRLRFPGFYNDAMAGAGEPQPLDLTALAVEAVTNESIPEPAVGETVRVPDIAIAAMAAVGQADAIASTLTYNGNVTQSGSPPAPFGETNPYTHALSGIAITRAPRRFVVVATVDNPITFQVSGGTDTDISSDADPDINQTNYPTVAADLTPDMSDLNGRPPRTQFWAKDLTIRHERFHASEDLTYGRSGVAQAQTWLSNQVASNVAGVNALLRQVPTRVANTVSTAMVSPAREERAYGDGAPAYLARANAIKKKGDAGGYGPGKGPGAGGTGTRSGSDLGRGAKVGIGIGGGALLGAGLGAAFGGGIGAAVGAGIGAVAGLIGGLVA